MDKSQPMGGGQAVIEGVMMRGALHAVTAVRKGKKILFRHDALKKKPTWCRWFFIRGVVNLWEMLVLGIKTLQWSATQAGYEGEQMSDGMLAVTLISSLLLSLGLFLLLPYLLTYWMGIRESSAPALFNVVDGIVKIAIFVAYVWLISLIKDIRRVFQYHGAEHKAVHCFEQKKPLEVAYARKFSTLHPRCGTSFIFLVMIIAIFLFSFIPAIAQVLFPGILNVHWLLQRLIYFLLRILMLPVVAGFSYELLRLSARKQQSLFFRVVSRPGLWLQRITTKEPSARQLEVALAALKKVLSFEKKTVH